MRQIEERLIDLSGLLGEAYQHRADTENELIQMTNQYNRVCLDLAPAEGWPGKNEEARSMARDRAIFEEPNARATAERLTEIRLELNQVGAGILALEAERRALEWTIRSRSLPSDTVEGEYPR